MREMEGLLGASLSDYGSCIFYWIRVGGPGYCCYYFGVGHIQEILLTQWDPMDCSPPDSSIHGILQARVLEWVAISFSRGSSQPKELLKSRPPSLCILSDAQSEACVGTSLVVYRAPAHLLRTLATEETYTNAYMHTHTHTHTHSVESNVSKRKSGCRWSLKGQKSAGDRS